MIACLLGAECTGKSTLTRQLGLRLADLGAVTVPEHLRDWCLRQGRTPRADEQAAIAAEQQRRIAAVAAAPLVVADTSGLMTAVYSAHYFGDDSLLQPALQTQFGYALTLLCSPAGLPWVADGRLRDGDAARQAVHQRLQALLDAARLPYRCISGPARDRLGQAEQVIRAAWQSHNARPC